ncbi:MAG: hypothetical protein ABF322_03935 [Lentimonas sp.]
MGKRLRQSQQPVGIHSGNSPKKLLLFGLPFVGIGIWITLNGLKVVEVDPQSVKAPYWLLTTAGAIFGLGGLMIWNMALQQIFRLKRIAKNVTRYPRNLAMTDYDWDTNGYCPPR